MQKLRKKHGQLIIVLLILGSAIGLVVFFVMRDNVSPNTKLTVNNSDTPVKVTEPVKTAGTLRFAAMGDMLAHDTVVQQAKRGDTFDFTAYFSKVTPLYQDADVVFCNPETITTGQTFGISGYPTFNAPTEFATDLVSGAHCNLINLASNHTNDKGQAGIDANLDIWSKQPVLAYAGSNRSTSDQKFQKYFIKNGLKVAFLAFADYSNNANLTSYGLNSYHDDALVTSLMTEARQNADAVIVSMHWGTEDSTVVNANQTTAAQRLSDLGADVVIGTGPHVLQPSRYLISGNGHRTLVWFSIGNMLSSQLQLNELTGGVAGFQLTKDSSGVKISDVSFKATYMSYDWSDNEKARSNLLARHNLLLQPLADANSNIQKMFVGENAATRSDYVRRTITSDAVTNFAP